MISGIILIVILLLEAWLGKTDMVKSGSTLELIFNLLKDILKSMKG